MMPERALKIILQMGGFVVSAGGGVHLLFARYGDQLNYHPGTVEWFLSLLAFLGGLVLVVYAELKAKIPSAPAPAALHPLGTGIGAGTGAGAPSFADLTSIYNKQLQQHQAATVAFAPKPEPDKEDVDLLTFRAFQRITSTLKSAGCQDGLIKLQGIQFDLFKCQHLAATSKAIVPSSATGVAP